MKHKNKYYLRELVTASLVFLFSLNLPALSQDDRPETQYLFSRFAKAEVLKKSGQKLETMMNYNCLTEEMIFVQNGRRMALANLVSIDTVYLQDRVFIPFENNFVELAVIGKADLFIQHRSKAKIQGEIVGYGGTSQLSNVKTVSSLRDNGQYFYMDMPENIEVKYEPLAYIRLGDKIKNFYNRRTLAKILPELKDDIKIYFKENKPDLENRSDLIELVAFINSKL